MWIEVFLLMFYVRVVSGQKKEGSEGITIVYRGMWRVTKGKKIEVAMKILKQESRDKYYKEYLELAGQWAFLQSLSVVKMFGLTLSGQLSIISEYMKLGPLDHYLKEHKSELKTVDLVEAASNLASALFHLEENAFVHGSIRCRKLFVSRHDENAFTIKLGDPGLHKSYASNEVHWIPIECYTNLEFAKRSTPADVWAFATTLWEIFTFAQVIPAGDHMQSMKSYKSGKRLSKPPSCPNEIYNVMKECWDADQYRRKKPQAIMRDINQILYEVYNSRRTHSYAKLKNLDSQSIPSTSTNSLASNITESTCIGYPEELLPVNNMIEFNDPSTPPNVYNPFLNGGSSEDEDTLSGEFPSIITNFDFSTLTTSLDSINSLQSVFELDANCNVVLQGRIGQGHYGEVYKGTLEYIADNYGIPRLVAVKKLKTNADSSSYQNFEREISIMKMLKHENIVEILGVLEEPEISLVMEFVPHGSLESYLKINKDSLSLKQLLCYAFDISQGMHYLGTKNIVHRDLAARNILVVDDNHVKITDFGLAQVMEKNYYILQTNRDLPIKWYAIESLREHKFSTRSDVWSYGVTLFEMFSHGEEPNLPLNVEAQLQDQQVLLQALEGGIRLPCPQFCTPAIYVKIIKPCWEEDPHRRPTFFELGGLLERSLEELKQHA